LACDSGKSEPVTAAAEAKPAEPVAPAKNAQASAPVQAAPAEAAPVEAAAPVQAAAPEGGVSESNPDAVDRTRFPDPEWYKPDVLPLSQIKHNGHTKPDENGFFASNMVLETQVELTAQKCIEAVQHQIGDAVPKWGEAETADDRITVRGDGERYQVTLVCGVVKGKTTASVNYRWTK
jgi:hypothetical protein